MDWIQQQGQMFKGNDVKRQEQDCSRIWVMHQSCSSWRAQPSEQLSDGHLGWCHHSISKWGEFFSVHPPLSYMSFLWRRIDMTAACVFWCSDLISALAPWQLSTSWEVYRCKDKVFHAVLPICISDVSLCGGTHNDLCFSSALLLLHRESDGKSQSRRREQNQ